MVYNNPGGQTEHTNTVIDADFRLRPWRYKYPIVRNNDYYEDKPSCRDASRHLEIATRRHIEPGSLQFEEDGKITFQPKHVCDHAFFSISVIIPHIISYHLQII